MASLICFDDVSTFEYITADMKYVQDPGPHFKDMIMKCVSCGKLSNSPYKLRCEHHLCMVCFHSIGEDDKFVCPSSSTTWKRCITSDRGQIQQNYDARTYINQLKVYCCFTSCNQVLQLSDFTKHVRDCKWKSSCPYCNKCIDDYDVHSSICENPPILCSLCKHAIMKEQYHICPMEIVCCKHMDVGCNVKTTRTEMIRHETDDNLQHLNVVLNTLSDYKRLVHNLQVQLEAMSYAMSSYQNTISADMVNLNAKVDNINYNISLQQQQQQPFEPPRAEASAPPSYEQTTPSSSINSKNPKAIETKLSANTKSLKDLKFQVANHFTARYDGILVWKVSDWKDRVLKAKSGACTSLQSAPFFTSPSGYQMRIEVFPNGNTVESRGKFLSLYLVMMVGTYDNILPWPFTNKVKMSIINRHHQKNKEIVIQPKSQQPLGLGLSFGVDKFLSIDLLNDDGPYVKDNTVYIRMEVLDVKNIKEIK